MAVRATARFLFLVGTVALSLPTAFLLEVTLFDTTSFPTDLPVTTYPQNDYVWRQTSFNDPQGNPIPSMSVCSVGQNRGNGSNWFRLPIQRSTSTVIYVNLTFIMRSCNEYPGQVLQCQTVFAVLKSEADRDYATASLPSWEEMPGTAYTLVENVAADYTYVESAVDTAPINTRTVAVKKGLSNGVYLAFRDRGTCMMIVRIVVFSRECVAMTYKFVNFPRVPAGSEASVAQGNCVPNAEKQAGSSQLTMICTASGEWLQLPGQPGCVCSAGFTAAASQEDRCYPCGYDTYKSAPGNGSCLACPANSHTDDSTSTPRVSCPCDTDFYRAPDEGPSAGCTQPPSEVRNLSVVNATTYLVRLSWLPPLKTGGRTDITYRVECEGCPQSVTYKPSTAGIRTESVIVYGLDAAMTYRFRVYAENGVSSVAGMATAQVTLDATTAGSRRGGGSSGGPVIAVGRIDQQEATSNSLTIVWAPVADAEWYEITYYPTKQPSDLLSLHSTTSTAVVTDLASSTAYSFKVRARLRSGQWSSSSIDTMFTTRDAPPINVIVGAIVAVVVCMAAVVAVVALLLRRNKQRRHNKGQGDCDTFGPFYNGARLQLPPISHPEPSATNAPDHLPPMEQAPPPSTPLFIQPAGGSKTYVDPHTYEDPQQAVREFTKEIDASFITIESVIGGGEFGDVCRGVLRVPMRPEVTVAIKTLKAGASEKSRLEFLTEASIMGQFDDPNVIYLEGVVTKSNPIMIVTEYMENGSLDTFLKNNDGKLTTVQLLDMLRGIASGMRYLSEMNYVHRDLAARNILVNNQLVCKVADFGLSREIEYDTSEGAYTTRGGKIPVRWTAPEAIAYRKFTSASDVWSFGIVMWEVMSFGERPYWNWSNQDVIKVVEQSYRLPPPMDCPEAVHQLMLDCWQKERYHRPKFGAIVQTLERLVLAPELLRKIAKPTTSPGFALDDVFDPRGDTIAAQFTSVEQWLQAIKMERYSQTFHKCGYTSLDQVAMLSPADLTNMGITLVGHQAKIMKSVTLIRHLAGARSSGVVSSELERFVSTSHHQLEASPLCGAQLSIPSAGAGGSSSALSGQTSSSEGFLV